MHLTQLAHMPELKMILSTHAQEHKHMYFDTTLKTHTQEDNSLLRKEKGFLGNAHYTQKKRLLVIPSRALT
jgi:hypothetical protein